MIGTHLLHLKTITIMIAPSSADMTDTIINVNAQPSSLAASVTEMKRNFGMECIIKQSYNICNSRSNEMRTRLF